MPLYYAAYLIKKVQKFCKLGSDISTRAESLYVTLFLRECVCLCMNVSVCVYVCGLSESNCVLASVHVCVLICSLSERRGLNSFDIIQTMQKICGFILSAFSCVCRDVSF